MLTPANISAHQGLGLAALVPGAELGVVPVSVDVVEAADPVPGGVPPAVDEAAGLAADGAGLALDCGAELADGFGVDDPVA